MLEIYNSDAPLIGQKMSVSKVRGGEEPNRVKLNDRPTDAFSGEVGDDKSLPRRKTNGTAPKRVACQSLEDRTAKVKP